MTHVAEAFAGFPAETFEFYEQLSANNTKAWWGDPIAMRASARTRRP